MSNEYHVFKRDGSVHISLNPDTDYLESFIDIFYDDEIKSPFKSEEEIELFAELIVKLLRMVT